MKNRKNHPQKTRDAKPFEIWIAQLPARKGCCTKCGRRPVVVISAEAYATLSHVSVIPLTKNLTARQLPTHVLLCSRFLDRPSRALCEQVTTVEKPHLIRRIGYVEEPFDRFALRRALALHLNLMPVCEFGVPQEDICSALPLS